MSNKLTDTQVVQEIRRVLEVEQFDGDAVRRVRELVAQPTDTPATMGWIREAIEDLGAYVQMWTGRKPLPQLDAPARAAAGQAVERIDRALELLTGLRSELVAEISQTDAVAARLDDQGEG